MWNAVMSYNHRRSFSAFLFSAIFIVCSSMAGCLVVSSSPLADAQQWQKAYSGLASCTNPSTPTSHSSLIVLLDRSQEAGTKDAQGYSTSVTKTLVDLWPGSIAVIPFSGDSSQTPVLGPAIHSDRMQQGSLKQKIASYPIGGERPLAFALQQALNLLQKQGNPAGSRVLLITAGGPLGQGINDKTIQESSIRSSIAQYCQAHIPVYAFGLNIDTQSVNGRDTNSLLSALASNTGANYVNVTQPQNLIPEVLALYTQWFGMTLIQAAAQRNNFPITIDSFALRVSIITFRSAGKYAVSLSGPNQQPVTTGITRTIDPRYEIDNLPVGGPITAGTYNINVGGDPNALVYALVESPLQVQLVTPNSSTAAYASNPVYIQAQFLNGNDILTPQTGKAQIIAKITLLINGQPAGPTHDIVLTQQGNDALFRGQSPVYNQPGQLHIELLGTYEHILRSTNFTLSLLRPSPQGVNPDPFSITFMNVIHQIATLIREGQHIYAFSAILCIAVVFVVIFFVSRWRKRVRSEQDTQIQRWWKKRRL